MTPTTKPVLVSGMKPTGRIHLGNYFGALKQFVDLQATYDAYIFIADLHALTQTRDAKTLQNDTHEMILDYLGAGLDPDQVTLYMQSDVPEVTELTWIFNCLTPMPYLMRAHAYKDAQAKGEEVNVGTFDYPILMAADILIQYPQCVPVGEDQRQHIEYARDTAERFNRTHEEIFPLPDGLIHKNAGTLPGTDGRKMSKSYNNTIPLFADTEQIKSAVMRIPTDSKAVEEPKNPDTCTVFALHTYVTPETDLNTLRKRYTEGGIGYKETKDLLIENIEAFLAPLRERRDHYKNREREVQTLLRSGAEVARERAQSHMRDIRRAVGLKR